MANHSEIQALLQRIATTLEAAGLSSEENSGGGDKGNHGRKLKPMGRIRAILQRSQLSRAEVKALHGVCKGIVEAVGRE